MKKLSFNRSNKVKRLIKAIDSGLLTKCEAAKLLGMNRETFRLYLKNYKEKYEVEDLEEIEEIEEVF